MYTRCIGVLACHFLLVFEALPFRHQQWRNSCMWAKVTSSPIAMMIDYVVVRAITHFHRNFRSSSKFTSSPIAIVINYVDAHATIHFHRNFHSSSSPNSSPSHNGLAPYYLLFSQFLPHSYLQTHPHARPVPQPPHKAPVANSLGTDYSLRNSF